MSKQLTTKVLKVTVPLAQRKKFGGETSKQFEKLRSIVTKLIRLERIEGPLRPLDESRQYFERLIELAKKYGDRHVATMQIMDYWILEKDLIHKMFKVLVPRFAKSDGPYTIQHRLTKQNPGSHLKLVTLEIKGNAYPRIITDSSDYRYTFTNSMIRQARYEAINKFKPIEIVVK